MNYTPILKLKQGEYSALLDLSEEQRKNVTPLIQIVHRFHREENPDGTISRYELTPQEALENAVNKVKGLGGFSKVYFDCRPLFTLNDNSIFAAMTSCSTLFGSNVVPVLTLADISEVEFDKHSLSFIAQQGILLRIFKNQVNENFFQEIDGTLKKIAIDRKSVDIMFDYSVTGQENSESVCRIIKKDRKINDWRSITFASGSFRENLSGLIPDTYYHKRDDFTLWKNVMEELKNVRLIGYADYTIQYPVYTLPLENSYPSRSFIYALEEQWVIFKGLNDTARGSAKTLQYFAHANQLIDKGLFAGETCCKGDEKILSVSKNSKDHLGTFTTWVQVGVTHHIAQTIRQLSILN